MPPGDVAITPTNEESKQHLTALRGLLDRRTVQELRQAARLWGWTLKGVAKTDLIEQMVSYLTDTATMIEAMAALTPDELVVLGWMGVWGSGPAPTRYLKELLTHGAGRPVAAKTIDTVLFSLTERCMLFFDEYYGYQLPVAYQRWLPRPAAPKLQYPHSERLQQLTLLTVTGMTQHVDHLLAAVTSERPPAVLATRKPPNLNLASPEIVDPRRPSLVAIDTLTRWGYRSEPQQHMARFLLEQMVVANLCQVDPGKGQTTLNPVQKSDAAWETVTVVERLQHLRQAYLTTPASAQPRLMSWTEFDMACPHVQSEGLQSSTYWKTVADLLQQVRVISLWLTGLVNGLPVDTWFGIESLCRLIFQLRRDLWSNPLQSMQWRWMVNKQPLEPQRIDFQQWMETYGRVIEAWLTGPASWLLFVQIGYAENQPVAFRVPSAVPVGVPEPPPPDVLRFMADGTIELTNDWRVNALRRTLRLFSEEVTRDASKTLLQPDPAAFRRALQSGHNAATVADALSRDGFPLPQTIQETLQTWASRAGRYQLYDQVAVVEFGEDVMAEELHAISRSSGAEYHQVAPRCIVFLDPTVVPALVDELRRRGYTPKVLA